MEASEPSSQEMLDRLLSEGKLSDDEYLRLSKAMLHKREPVVNTSEQPAARPPLHKSRNRMLGGVCAGIAEHFGCDPVIVRVIAIILLMAMPPITTVVYLVLYFMLPWGGEKVALLESPGKPWRFAAWVVLFLTVAPLLIIKLLMAQTMEIYSQLGSELPTLSRFVFTISNAYLHWGVYASLLVVGLATAVYLMGDARFRRIYSSVFLFMCFLWSLMMAIGFYSALFALPKVVVRP